MYVPSITIDTVIEALAALIQPFIGSTQIIRGQVNRVPPPNGSFVELTEISKPTSNIRATGTTTRTSSATSSALSAS